MNMKIYLTGVFIAFIIGLINTLVRIGHLSATKNRNLEKINLFYNPYKNNYTQEKSTGKFIAFLIFNSLILAPLLSWLAVAWSAFVYLKSFIHKGPAAEKIKDMNAKLSSKDLSEEQMKFYQEELYRLYGINHPGTDVPAETDPEDEDTDLYILEEPVEEDDWCKEMLLNHQLQTFTLSTRSQDYASQLTEVMEYKFVGAELWVRTIEDKTKQAGEELYWDIKNNAVMQQSIKNRMGNHYKSEDIENAIARLKKAAQWQECRENKIKYFIMFRHAALFTDFDVKKYLWSELERINHGYKKLGDEINKLGGYITKDSLVHGGRQFKTVNCNDGLSEEEQIHVYEMIKEENISKFGLSYYEFVELDSIRKDLETYLAKLTGLKLSDIASMGMKGQEGSFVQEKKEDEAAIVDRSVAAYSAGKKLNIKIIMLLVFVILSLVAIIYSIMDHYQNITILKKQAQQQQTEKKQVDVEMKQEQSLQKQEEIIESELASCKDNCFVTFKSSDVNVMSCVDACEQHALARRAEIRK